MPDFQAEVFQIGILAYFIFHNGLPFLGHTWREQVANIRYAAPVWETFVPVPIRKLIDTALHKDPTQRFASATDMLVAYQTIQ